MVLQGHQLRHNPKGFLYALSAQWVDGEAVSSHSLGETHSSAITLPCGGIMDNCCNDRLAHGARQHFAAHMASKFKNSILLRGGPNLGKRQGMPGSGGIGSSSNILFAT